MIKPNLIITACDSQYADFVIEHWLRSLRQNVDLTGTTVSVIDYGMTHAQKSQLESQSVQIISGSKSGHVVTMRFIDLAAHLVAHSYEQVLLVDGGDIIFQSDIAHLFSQHQQLFRAVQLDHAPRSAELLAYQHNFSRPALKHLTAALKDKPVLNAGFILGPARLFIALGKEMDALVKNKSSYGPDQIVVNYVLYRSGVRLLDSTYNYLLGTAHDGFVIKNGQFFTKTGKKIAVVHNGGHTSLFRPVAQFGFGPKRNKLKLLTYLLKNSFFRLLTAFHTSR